MLCLEHVSLLRSRTVRKYIKEVDTLAIFEPYGTLSEHRLDPHEVDRTLSRWSRDLRGVTVCRLTHREYFNEMIEAGEEAIQFLEAEGSAFLKGTPVYERLHRLLESEAVMLALKKGLVPYIKDRIHFCKIVTRLAVEPGRHIIVVPAHHDEFSLLPRWFRQLGDRIKIPPDLEEVSRRRDRVRQLRYVFYALAGLPVRLNRQLFGSLTPVTWKHVRPCAVDWAKTIVVGFDESRSPAGRVSRWDDNLEDEGPCFAPSRFLYVHGMWRFPKKKIARWRRMLEARGARFVDTWRLRMPATFYASRKIPASWQRLRWCVEGLWKSGMAPLFEVGHTIAEAYVEAHLFMQYYRPKVYDVRDEYLVGHIVRTIVFNQYGCKTIGVHHGAYASLGLNPHLAYVYCDTYCAYGPAYFERIWKGTWSFGAKQVLIGVERNGYTHRASRNEARRTEFRTKYAGAKVLLWCPPSIGLAMLNRMEMAEEVFRTLADFLAEHEEWVVIMHCRPPERVWFAGFMDKMGKVSRVVTEERFSTYELIAYAEAVLVSNISTVGIEALCAGRERVLFVNYWGEWNHPCRRYSPDLVASNAKELAVKLEAWARGERGQDPIALEAFRRDFDVGFDGRALERYKDEMRALAGLQNGGPASAVATVERR